MNPGVRSRGLGAALMAGLILAAMVAGASADSKKGDDWEHSFSGHDMWMKSLDEALARSQKDQKPLLIDFYSHT